MPAQPYNTVQPRKGITLERVLLVLILILQCGIFLSIQRTHRLEAKASENTESITPPLIETFSNRVSLATDTTDPDGPNVYNSLPFDMDAMMLHALAEFEQMQHRVDFDRGWSALSASPSMDMWDKNTDYVVIFSLPDLNQSRLQVTLDGRLLTVSSESKRQAHGGSRYRSYSRSIWLPGPVDNGQQAKALVTNGVLRITIPKGHAEAPTRLKTWTL